MLYHQKNNHRTLPISQHFLTNGRLLTRIVSLSTIGKQDAVLEIGTGKGHLAGVLAGRCKTLYTIEINRKLYGQAQRKLLIHSNIHLLCGDFLAFPLPKHKPYKVFANIPFSITSQIIKKLTDDGNPPSDMWLVMDKGAAKNYLGKPYESLQSLLLKPKWDMRIVYYFRREDFHPSPSVDTVLVHFSHKRQPDVPPEHWRGYKRFVERGLTCGVCGNQRLLTKKQAVRALKAAGYPPDIRNDLMLYVQWLCLFRCYCNANSI